MGEISATSRARHSRGGQRDLWRRRGHLIAGRSWRDAAIVLLALAGSAFMVFAAVTVMLRFLDPVFEMAVVLPAVAVGGLLLFLVPVQLLPATALVLLSVFPMRLIPNDGPFNALPPLAIFMGIWVFRRVVLGHRPRGVTDAPADARDFAPRFGVYAIAILFTAWLAVSITITVADETTIGWAMAFVASVFLPLLVFDARAEARLLANTFLVVGAFLGVYLLGEMVLGVSPIYGTIEAVLGLDAEEELEFSVYRARAGFAHPLHAAAFLAVPAAMGIGRWLMTGRIWPLVLAALSGGGILATVSRGSVLAIAMAVAFAVVVAPFFLGWRRLSRWALLVVLTVVGGIVVLNFGPLVERSDSMESQISADVRDRAFGVAMRAAEASGWLGTGPGTSGETGRLYDFIVIENSLLQLLMSVGLPGLVLFALFIAALLWVAFRHRDLPAMLGIIAYIASITTFNSIDGVRGMHIVLGFLAIMALNGSLPAPRPTRSDAAQASEGDYTGSVTSEAAFAGATSAFTRASSQTRSTRG